MLAAAAEAVPPYFLIFLLASAWARSLAVIVAVDLDLEEVETIEWKKIADDEVISDKDMYSLRIHMKSGKMFTRQVFESQFEEVKEQYKELIGDE